MKRVPFLILIVASLVGFYGMAGRPPLLGSPAPEIALKDLQGQEVRLSDLHGKIVLLNFWATWCKPCKEEMPAMQASYEKLRDQGFVVLAVNELEDVEKVAEHRVANQYGVVGLPASFLIDRQGIVREHIFGNLLTEQRIAELVRQYGGASASLHR